MNALVNRTGNDLKEMASILATYPTPDKWSPGQKAQAIQFAALLDTAQKMIAAASLAGIDYQAEREKFLENASRTQSVHTQTAYRTALRRLDAWAGREKIDLLELTPAQADNFIYSLGKEQPRASASVRLDISAASSFYTWLHRRHTAVENPFRGTKARPAKKPGRETVIPSAEEVEIMIRELPAFEAAAVSVMAFRGLRAGALPTLTINGEKFAGQSKGKKVEGKLPSAALDAIKAARLPRRRPFAGVLPNTLEKQIARAIGKLCKAGKVQAAYSSHDLRHFYSVTEYRRDKDIHRVSKLLGHASILVTENYLKGLGEVE